LETVINWLDFEVNRSEVKVTAGLQRTISDGNETEHRRCWDSKVHWL